MLCVSFGEHGGAVESVEAEDGVYWILGDEEGIGNGFQI